MTEGEPEKDKGGRPAKKPIVPVEQVIEAARNGVGYRELAAETGIGEDAARMLKKTLGLTREEFIESERAHQERVMELARKQVEATMPKASAMQAATVYGIFSDKHSRPSASISNHLHLHVGGKGRAELMKGLIGRHSERVATLCDPVSTSKPVGPVIDLETVPAAPKEGAVDSKSTKKAH